jgi:hypothetical protein
MKRIYILLSALFLIVFINCAFTKMYRYKMDVGIWKINLDYHIAEEQGFNVISVFDFNNYLKVYCDDKYNTVMVKMIDNKITNVAWRVQDSIYISHMTNGRYETNIIKIDSSPWFVLNNLQLKNFINSNEKKIDYWFLSPEMTIEKMIATKNEEETVKFNGERVLTYKVSLPVLMDNTTYDVDYYFNQQGGDVIKYTINNGIGKTTVRLNKICE